MRRRQLHHKITTLSHDRAHSQRVADAPVLTDSTRHQILYEWNDTRAEFPNVCVHELFEQQVLRDPGAVAVVFNQRLLSYGELNERANQVAHYLQKLGVGAESLVGVCMQRSPEMVIALLGIWKAGGAYVPLDPAYPRERLSFMLKDAGVKVLLTEEKCVGLSLSAGGLVVCLDGGWPIIAQESGENLAAVATPSNLAYVIYTSGSTGQPKGVMILQRGLVNYLWWAMRNYAVDAGSPVPIHSSIAFDSTVASLYPPLLSGGQIEILPEKVGAESLVAALGEMKSRSKVVITPAHLELLTQAIAPEEMGRLTTVLVIAGEPLLAERLSQWRDFAPLTRVFNEYGPTETTVGCCAYEVQADDTRSGAVPIGQPIANVQLYVLDADLRPVPPGVVGELYIGGAGVARGYLNRPELTRERFVDDPFSEQNGSRLYRTGDLVRYVKARTLEFRGRIDDQVKIRGYRIELGEIEGALAGHPGVQCCKVLAREDTPGDKQLVVYVIAREKESLKTDSLQNFLRQRLPKYMVPAYFVFLDSLPLNRNGKVDSQALPAPSCQNVTPNQKFVAPRNEAERRLAAIWIELLKVERVGIHDDFFDIGADSLMALRALSKIRDRFGMAPSMETFYASATVATIAAVLKRLEEERDRPPIMAPVRQGRKEPPFVWIGPATQGRVLSAQLDSNQPFIAIGIGSEIVNQPMPLHRMEEIAAHLVSALRKKQPRGPYRLGGYCLSAVFAYEVARQLTMMGQEVELLVLFEPLNPRQSAAVRLITELRRTYIRVGLHLGKLRRMHKAEIPAYARSWWKSFKAVLRDQLWGIFARSRFLNSRLRSPELEKILFFAANSYTPKALACPTVIFRSKDGPILSAGDPYFGWRELLIGPSETHEVSGDHEGIFREPNVRILAEKLRGCLNSARRSATFSDELAVD
jgi:amino acid adenylation domain-containing protein